MPRPASAPTPGEPAAPMPEPAEPERGGQVLVLRPTAEGWRLELPGQAEVLSRRHDRARALTRAREEAVARRPSRLLILDQNGSVEEQYEFP